MSPNTYYSDFTTVSAAFDDTSNTLMGRILVAEIYWFFALFAWIVVTNLDMIEEWLRRPSLSVQPISKYNKEQRRIRRLHETSILLLSFGALLFLVRRQDDKTLSLLPSSGLHPCSGVQGKGFWRCISTRSMSLPERTKVVQQNRSIVGDGGNNHLDANKHTGDRSSASGPLLIDHLDKYLTKRRVGDRPKLSDYMDMIMTSSARFSGTGSSQSSPHADDRVRFNYH